nr:seed lectin-like [Ipomoea trifida]
MAAAALYTFLNIFAFLFLLLASLVYSLSFNLTNFGPDYANAINLYGDASFLDQAIQLTPEQAYKAGRAMYVNLFHLWDKASGDLADFATTFSFNIKSDGSDYGDGLTFFLAGFSNPSDTSMTSGGGLGLMNENPLLTAVDPFVAVVFDTYSSLERRPQTKVSINIGSTLEYNVSKEWRNSIARGANNNAFITYSASSQILQVSFTGYLGLGTWTEDSLSFKVDLRDHLPENVCIGFSAATGSLFEKHTINSWQFNSTTPGATTGGTVISPSSSPPPTPPLPNPPPPNPPPPNPPHYHKVRIKLSTLEVIGLCIGVPIIVFGIGACIYGQCRKRSRRSKNTITLGKNSAKAGAKVVKATQDPTLECCANKVGEVPVEPTPECCVNVAQEEPCDGVAEGEEACGAFQAVLSVFGIA